MSFSIGSLKVFSGIADAWIVTTPKAPRILVVDDEPDLRGLLEDEIRSLGFGVLAAEDGEAAFGLIRETLAGRGEPIDAILADINMPRMNGLRLLAEARALGIETPFVFLTAYGDKEKAVQALRLGALDFLDKPYDRDLLLKTMRLAGELGVQMRELDSELRRLCQEANVPEEKKAMLARAQREVLLLRWQGAALRKVG